MIIRIIYHEMIFKHGCLLHRIKQFFNCECLLSIKKNINSKINFNYNSHKSYIFFRSKHHWELILKLCKFLKKITEAKGSETNLTAAYDSSVKKTLRKVEKCLNVHRDKAGRKTWKNNPLNYLAYRALI